MYIPSLDQMILTLASNMPALMRLLTALSYVIGLALFGQALFALKHYGEMRTMQSSSTDIRGPLVLIIMATMLIYVPSAVHIGIGTLWESDSVLQYVSNNPSSTESILLSTIIDIMMVIGTLSFIRGLILLSRVGKGDKGQPGQFAKGISHVVAGILAINLYASWQVLLNTFGITL
jgi:intracellular multiplication protein IcmC